MNCSHCGSSMERSKTTFTIEKNGTLYVVEDVPCWECSVCEHVVYEQEAAKELERYTSGKLYPYRYRQAFVFIWDEPVMEKPIKSLEVTLQNTPLELSIVGTGR